MTFFEWFRSVNGKFITNANAPKQNPYQCMQLMHDYKEKVLGLPITTLRSPTARQLWLNFPNVEGSKYFRKIANRPWLMPKQGAIVLMNVGPDGHVCVYNEGDPVRKFTSVDQNFPLHSPVHIQEHKWGFLGRDVYGWLEKI